jgi:hypothetical protein
MTNERITEIAKFGALFALVAFACPHEAYAGNMQITVKGVLEAMQDLPIIVSGAVYIWGGGTILAGANRLKMHAENPQQTRLSDGVTRIAVGGMTASLPTLIGWINNTFSIGDNQVHFHSLGRISSLLTMNLFS